MAPSIDVANEIARAVNRGTPLYARHAAGESRQVRTCVPVGFARANACGGLAVGSIVRRQAFYVAGAIGMAMYLNVAN